ncbi:MAG: ABC transporter substrate-binding protein, partial [Sulfobacillus sp.]
NPAAAALNSKEGVTSIMTKLKGITWNHSRGYVPMIATAQRFFELHPEIEIKWEKRSLQEFADLSLDRLTEQYDLLVIDHPWVGHVSRRGLLVSLQDVLPAAFLADQSLHSVGASHESYSWDGHQWALAIDTAAPVASFRSDLLDREGLSVPETWEDILTLARRGQVVFPGIAIDSLMNFYMICSTLGEDPFQSGEEVVSAGIGMQALELLKELISLCPPAVFSWNPIRVYEFMTRTDEALYCPFAYGYSNYARPGYARRALTFADTVTLGQSGHLRTTLGGAGLAVSKRCQDLESVVEYVQYVASPECQKTIYLESGGQPGHRDAWLDEEANRRTGQYFRSTLPALDRAYLRPRNDGYLHFQDQAGEPVQRFLQHGGDAAQVLDELNRLYRLSQVGVHS